MRQAWPGIRRKYQPPVPFRALFLASSGIGKPLLQITGETLVRQVKAWTKDYFDSLVRLADDQLSPERQRAESMAWRRFKFCCLTKFRKYSFTIFLVCSF